MRKFNEQTPDVPGVKYYSWGATYQPGLIDTWKWSHAVVLEKEGPNDGLVSLQSAQWVSHHVTPHQPLIRSHSSSALPTFCSDGPTASRRFPSHILLRTPVGCVYVMYRM